MLLLSSVNDTLLNNNFGYDDQNQIDFDRCSFTLLFFHLYVYIKIPIVSKSIFYCYTFKINLYYVLLFFFLKGRNPAECGKSQNFRKCENPQVDRLYRCSGSEWRLGSKPPRRGKKCSKRKGVEKLPVKDITIFCV